MWEVMVVVEAVVRGRFWRRLVSGGGVVGSDGGGGAVVRGRFWRRLVRGGGVVRSGGGGGPVGRGVVWRRRGGELRTFQQETEPTRKPSSYRHCERCSPSKVLKRCLNLLLVLCWFVDGCLLLDFVLIKTTVKNKLEIFAGWDYSAAPPPYPPPHPTSRLPPSPSNPFAAPHASRVPPASMASDPCGRERFICTVFRYSICVKRNLKTHTERCARLDLLPTGST